MEGNGEKPDSEAGISVTTGMDTQQSNCQNMECLVMSNRNTFIDSAEINNSGARAPTVPSTSEVILHDSQNMNNLTDGDVRAEATVSTRSAFNTCEETQFMEPSDVIPQQVTSPNASLTRSVLPRNERYK